MQRTTQQPSCKPETCRCQAMLPNTRLLWEHDAAAERYLSDAAAEVDECLAMHVAFIYSLWSITEAWGMKEQQRIREGTHHTDKFGNESECRLAIRLRTEKTTSIRNMQDACWIHCTWSFCIFSTILVSLWFHCSKSASRIKCCFAKLAKSWYIWYVYWYLHDAANILQLERIYPRHLDLKNDER